MKASPFADALAIVLVKFARAYKYNVRVSPESNRQRS